jgi:hypothetical protein
MYGWVMCKVMSSVLVLFQQWSLLTMKGICHNHAALCDLCTTVCHSVEDRHKYCCVIQFLCEEGAILVDVHSWLKHVFSDDGLQCVQRWEEQQWGPGTSWSSTPLCGARYTSHSGSNGAVLLLYMLWCISEHLGVSLECASHHHARSGLLKNLCSMDAKQFERQTGGNSNGCLLGTSAVVWKRGRQVFGSYCRRIQMLVFALWSWDYTHVSAVETSIISLTKKELRHTRHR